MKLGFGLSIVGQRLAGGGVAPFTPADLFASGDEGALFLSGLTTCFLSATNLTPAGVGDTVGFQLDESQGAGYSGGSFTGLGVDKFEDKPAASWTAYSNNTVADAPDGGIEITFVDNQFGAKINIAQDDQPFILDTSKVFIVEFEARVTGGSASARVANLGGSSQSQAVSTSTYETHSFSGSWDGGGSIDLDVSGLGAGEKFFYRNISIRQIPGNHATQPTVAARPTLRQTVGGVYYLEDDEVDDALSWTAPADTDYTISYVDSAGNVTTLTGQSLSGATNILLDPDLVGYLAIDRGLTAGEQSDLDTYWGTLT